MPYNTGIKVYVKKFLPNKAKNCLPYSIKISLPYDVKNCLPYNVKKTLPNDVKICLTFTEIKSEFIRAVKNGNRKELMDAILQSDRLLDATWKMDSDTVAQIIEDIHMDEAAPDFYNNEQALRSVVKIAYISAVDYYAKIEELPTGKGYADIVFWPKKDVSCPALIVELKWNKTSEAATDQIIQKKYSNVFKRFSGDVLIVGISYDARTKTHSCDIRRLEA